MTVRIRCALAAAILLSIPRARAAEKAEPPTPGPRDHHTIGDVTYTDADGDGRADRQVRTRGDGSAIVLQDTDGDGAYDARFEQGADGTLSEPTDIQEPAPTMTDVRSGSAVPVGWYIYGFPAWQVISLAAAVIGIPLLLLLAIILLWRRRKAAAGGTA